MGRREDIEKQLNKNYKLLNKLEDMQRTETHPKNELRWEEEIEEVHQRINQLRKELSSFNVPSVQPEPTSNKVDDYFYTNKARRRYMLFVSCCGLFFIFLFDSWLSFLLGNSMILVGGIYLWEVTHLQRISVTLEKTLKKILLLGGGVILLSIWLVWVFGLEGYGGGYNTIADYSTDANNRWVLGIYWLGFISYIMSIYVGRW